MADIVNLRTARKQKARAGRELKAAENRAVHGRRKADLLAERKIADRATANLDGHRLNATAKDD